MNRGKTQLHIVTSVSKRDLDAAGIFDPALRESYELCRQLNAEHGKTHYLATLLATNQASNSGQANNPPASC